MARSTDDSLLRQSRAAASFDAVVALALAYDKILQVNKSALEYRNISQILNDTLSKLKFNGLAVSTPQVPTYALMKRLNS